MKLWWSVARGARDVVWVAGAPARWALIGLIRVYRATLAGVLGGQCRFHPSCSQYAEEAIRARGAVAGTALTAWRLLRCTPFSRGGIDRPPARRRRASEYESVILQVPGGPA